MKCQQIQVSEMSGSRIFTWMCLDKIS